MLRRPSCIHMSIPIGWMHLCAESLCAATELQPGCPCGMWHSGGWNGEGTGTALPAVRGRCAPPGSCPSHCLGVRRSWELPGASRGLPADGGCGARKRFPASRGGRDGPFQTLRTAIVLPFLCRERGGCCLGDYQWRSLINQTGFDSFCSSAGFSSFFFSFPTKHPKHFQPLA